MSDRNNGWHPVVYRGNKFIRRHCDHTEGSFPLAILITPILPNAGDAEEAAIFHSERVLFPLFVALIEPVHRHDAAAPGVGVAEHAFLGNSFGASIDRLDLRTRFHPMRDKTPA